jgi:integrase
MKSIRKVTRLSSRCYLYILLIQLRNGSRVSEAVRAFKQFIMTGKPEVEIPVSKKKRPETRLMVLPEEIADKLKECVDYVTVDDDKLTTRVKVYAVRNLKINTHSLRYSFITYLIRTGVNPTLVAKITRHSKLDYILHYTQEKVADRILKEL